MASGVRDGRDYFGADLETTLRTHPGFVGAQLALGFAVPPLDDVADAAPVAATINHGRLIVECPDCRGAEMVWRERPLLLCHSCGNRAVGGEWRRVALPGDLPALEAELSERADAATRNWRPGETVDDLRREREERR
jgi:hypothetical protein